MMICNKEVFGCFRRAKSTVDGPEVASAIGQHISVNSDGENPKWLTETVC